MMKNLDEFLVFRRKIRKYALQKLSVKDRMETSKIRKELFPDNLESKDLENRSPRYWRTKMKT